MRLLAILSLALTASPLAWSQSPAPPATAAAQPGATATLEAIYWRLTRLGETEVAAKDTPREPHLVFGPGGTVTGSDGCNSLRGTYEVRGDTLRVRSLMGTLMACTLPNDLDRHFRDALGKTGKWKASATDLTLLDESGAALARFAAVPR